MVCQLPCPPYTWLGVEGSPQFENPHTTVSNNAWPVTASIATTSSVLEQLSEHKEQFLPNVIYSILLKRCDPIHQHRAKAGSIFL